MTKLNLTKAQSRKLERQKAKSDVMPKADIDPSASASSGTTSFFIKRHYPASSAKGRTRMAKHSRRLTKQHLKRLI